MTVMISLLRAVNLGGHNKIPMNQLRVLCESLKLRDVQTYIQSGNVVFRTGDHDPARLAARLEKAIEREFGFHVDVIVSTCSELRDAIAKNPFAKRRDIDPRKFLVTFLAGDPDPVAREKVSAIKADPEELRIDGRELYIYFANGLARPKLSWMAIAKTLKTSGTGRNWNTVVKLLEMAEKLEASG